MAMNLQELKRILQAALKRLVNKKCAEHVWAVPDLAFAEGQSCNRFLGICSRCGERSIRTGADWLAMKMVGESVVGTGECKEFGDWSMVKGEHGCTIKAGIGSFVRGGRASNLTGDNDSVLCGGDGSVIAGGSHSVLTGGYGSRLTGKSFSTLIARRRSTLSGGYASTLIAGDGSILTGEYGCLIRGGCNSVLTGGDNCVLVGDTGSTVAAGRGSIVVIRRSDGFGLTAARVKDDDDSGRLEPNTPYRLDSHGRFVKVEEAQ